ncbi:phosphotransferase [Hamadaea tsunoensis]|uniref:phosphotransferase n=1 Tax=Hamadaea tsunoensis TaxID=53368 RepID=UPI0004024B87|nr:phosphotransferase [Hamadaea tsunoensis]
MGTGLPDEATRLRWAADRVRAPRLIEYGSDGFQDWLMTAELSGAGAAEHPLRTSDPVRLATVFAQGLRAFHDAFDVDDCPFDFRLPTALRAAGDRVAAAERLSAARAAAADRAAADRVAADRVAADRLVANANTTDAVAEREATEREAAEREAAETEAAAKAGADEPRALLERARVLAEEITGLSADAWDTGEDLVVCHGDYCLPNAFLEDGSPDGTAVTGYIDLGGLAVADRWYDLAVALRSLEQPYNLGPGYGAVFLDAYGAKMDERKNELYLILYDLTF